MKNLTIKRTVFCSVLLLSLFLIGITDTFPENTSDIKNLTYELTWAEFDGENYEIYYSSMRDSQWTQKIQLTDNDLTNLYPGISSGNDGITWIIWTALNGTESKLYYSYHNGNSWSYPEEILTNLSSNTSPSILVDNENIPWIVWAGFDGQDDDIYYSKWNGNDWDIPVMINKDNSLPDVLPTIGVNEYGNTWVLWMGYDGETYSNYLKQWNGIGWNDEIVVDNYDLYIKSTLDNELFLISNLPSFIDNQDYASIHVKNSAQVQSIRLKDLIKRHVKDEDLAKNTSRPFISNSDDVYTGFGDSITQGAPFISSSGNGRRVGGYEPHLETLLNQSGNQSVVLNYGVAGENTAGGLNRIGSVLSGSNSNIILIMEGTNDIGAFSRTTTISNLSAMIDVSRDKGVEPILATLTPDTRPGHGFKNIPRMNDLIEERVVSVKGVRLADQYDAVESNWESLSDDRLHPNDDGYKVIAEEWFNSINKPKVETSSATITGNDSVTLNGAINPNGFLSIYYFEYGRTEDFGGATLVKRAGSGDSDISVSADISGLDPGTNYYYRLIAVNSNGKSYGGNLTFNTSTTTVSNTERIK